MSIFGLTSSDRNILKVNTFSDSHSDAIDAQRARTEYRKMIEPWLSAIFQSDHLSVLVGAGLTAAVAVAAGTRVQGMERLTFSGQLGETIKDKADQTAKAMGRCEANLEDDLRVALDIHAGLVLLDDGRKDELKPELSDKLNAFIRAILETESEFLAMLSNVDSTKRDKAVHAFSLLQSFVLSFASRTTSRERLNIFTTNYDRFLELACDETGVLLLDRFKGKLRPVFRNTRLDLDFHYNPPGIRGEPRYVEGVSRLTKLHGSVDWQFEAAERIVRSLLPFGAPETHPEIPSDPLSKAVIFPNSAKDIETAFYPYAELFRDFSSAICQPNSAVVAYGYGFGDSHINRVLEDMLQIPSTHLAIISWDSSSIGTADYPFGAARQRVIDFLSDKNDAQITLLMGEHFGDLGNLVRHYLPKSAIDRLTIRMQSRNSALGNVPATAHRSSFVIQPPAQPDSAAKAEPEPKEDDEFTW